MSFGGEPVPSDSTPTQPEPNVTPYEMSTRKCKAEPVVSPQARLEALIGREFARFLIASLSEAHQGRRG